MRRRRGIHCADSGGYLKFSYDFIKTMSCKYSTFGASIAISGQI